MLMLLDQVSRFSPSNHIDNSYFVYMYVLHERDVLSISPNSLIISFSSTARMDFLR